MFRKKNQPRIDPVWLVVGLGNPGPEYHGTRHNVGFEAIDRLVKEYGKKLNQSKFNALFTLVEIDGVPVALAKPLTFMNLSGQAVAPLMKSFGLSPANVLVLADDLDLPVGKLRLRASGSSGGNNGHKSLVQHLKTEAYPRIKIGIGRPSEGAIDYVLGKFNPEERVDIERALTLVERLVPAICRDGVDAGFKLLEQTA